MLVLKPNVECSRADGHQKVARLARSRPGVGWHNSLVFWDFILRNHDYLDLQLRPKLSHASEVIHVELRSSQALDTKS